MLILKNVNALRGWHAHIISILFTHCAKFLHISVTVTYTFSPCQSVLFIMNGCTKTSSKLIQSLRHQPVSLKSISLHCYLNHQASGNLLPEPFCQFHFRFVLSWKFWWHVSDMLATCWRQAMPLANFNQEGMSWRHESSMMDSQVKDFHVSAPLPRHNGALGWYLTNYQNSTQHTTNDKQSTPWKNIPSCMLLALFMVMDIIMMSYYYIILHENR